MATSILAPGNEEDDSSEIVLADGESATISIYNEEGDPLPNTLAGFPVQRKNVLEVWENVSTVEIGFVKLRHDSMMLTISSPGTYRVHRPDISADTEAAFGVQLED